MTTLAIDIGGTKLAAALIDNNLRISQRRELPTPASKTPDALREALKALVEPLRAEARQVAIASTGIIQEGMLLALNPHNLGGLLHFPLVQTLETIAGLPTLAVNDAQAAAWAEYHARTQPLTGLRGECAGERGYDGLTLKRHGFRLGQVQRRLARHRLGNHPPVANRVTGRRLATYRIESILSG